MKPFMEALFVLCVASASSKTGLAAGYSFAAVKYAGSSSTIVYGISKSGQSAGAGNSGGTWNGFVSNGGIPSTFNPGSTLGGYAEGINDSGQVVGLNLDSGSGFLLNQGAFTAIVVPRSDSGSTNAIGINDSGQIVGSYKENGALLGFLLSGATYTTIAVPGAASTVACGINNSGQIVGWYVSNGATSGFSLSGGIYTAIAFPGAASTQALGVNDSGEIVGRYSNGGSNSGFVLQNGQYTGLSVPNSSNTTANGVNDAGQIVGSYVSGGVTLGFSAAPEMVAFSILENPLNPAGLDQYNLPYNATSVGAIAIGSDGAVWYTAQMPVFDGAASGLMIGRMLTSGVATVEYLALYLEIYPLGPVPPFSNGGIALGSDGAVWYPALSAVEHADQIAGMGGPIVDEIYSIARTTTSGATTTSSTIFEENFSSEGNFLSFVGPGGIVTGPDGALWFGLPNENEIGRMTVSGAYASFPLPTQEARPIALAAGPDGALWFTEQGDNSIGRITTSGVVTEFSLPTPDASPVAITSGPDGAMWFTEAGDDSIGRIDAGSGAITEFPVPTSNAFATGFGGGIATGADGALWFTESNQTTLGRITTDGTLAEYVLPAGAGGGAGIVSGPDASLWIAQLFNIGQVAVQNPPLSNVSISVTHAGDFIQGQSGAAYTLTVSNLAGASPTAGFVTVTDVIPAGMSLTSMVGSGWTCSGNTCSRSNSLPAGASYPPITVTLTVAANAASPQVNQATVSGGGSTSSSATDLTAIDPPHAPFFMGEVGVGDGFYYLVFPNGTLFGYYKYLADSFIYHADLGYEYVLPSGDAGGDVYLWDYQSQHWWYTGPNLFPNLYDFTLGEWIFYFSNSANPGHYTSSPREFASDTTHLMFMM
jgi:uncharacterized repeat protein (TIGR01451 family)